MRTVRTSLAVLVLAVVGLAAPVSAQAAPKADTSQTVYGWGNKAPESVYGWGGGSPESVYGWGK